MRVRVPRHVLEDTKRALSDFGTRGYEGFVLWVGRMAGDVASVVDILVPPQEPLRDERGVGYFVDGRVLLAVNQFLHARRLRLIAQVHSHPGEAYHSAADDRYAVVTREGGLSIVVPDFARGPASLGAWAVYRLTRGTWQRLSDREVDTTFVIEE